MVVELKIPLKFIKCGDDFSVFEAEPCDPNVLGFISDLALQVDNIDVRFGMLHIKP